MTFKNNYLKYFFVPFSRQRNFNEPEIALLLQMMSNSMVISMNECIRLVVIVVAGRLGTIL